MLRPAVALVRPLLPGTRVRCLVIVVVVVVAVVLGIAVMGSVARAEPPPDPAAASALPSSAKAYAEFGATAGAGIGLYAAGTGEIGYRLGDGTVWIHGGIQSGSVVLYGPIDEAETSGGYLALRAGVDERGCDRRGVWCVFAGTDLGYLHQYASTKSEHSDHRVGMFAPRIGLDAGGRGLRLRLGLETSISLHNWETLGVAAGMAFAW